MATAMSSGKILCGTVVFLAALACASSICGASTMGRWRITQLTARTDHHAGPLEVDISGSRVVWSALDLSHAQQEREIFLYEDGMIRQLTFNSYRDHDRRPRVSESCVIWTRGGWYNLFYYDGVETRQLPSGTGGYPEVSGSSVVWQGSSEDYRDQILLHKDGATTQLTTVPYNSVPDICGDRIAWVHHPSGQSEEYIHLLDGTGLTRLPSPYSYEKDWLRVSDTAVVWSGDTGPPFSGQPEHIYLYDGETTRQISLDGYENKCPELCGSRVVWLGRRSDEDDWDVFYYDGDEVLRLTNNAVDEENAQIAEEYVAWRERPGPTGPTNVYVYDGSATTQLGQAVPWHYSARAGLRISGNNVVWIGEGAQGEEEVFLATAAGPGDANLDGVVNDDDLSLLLANWTGVGGEGRNWGQGNFDRNGAVSDADLSLLLANWTGQPAAAIPEPVGLSLLTVAGLVFIQHRGARHSSERAGLPSRLSAQKYVPV